MRVKARRHQDQVWAEALRGRPNHGVKDVQHAALAGKAWEQGGHRREEEGGSVKIASRGCLGRYLASPTLARSLALSCLRTRSGAARHLQPSAASASLPQLTRHGDVDGGAPPGALANVIHAAARKGGRVDGRGFVCVNEQHLWQGTAEGV